MEEDDFLDRVDRYLMPETATGTAGVVGMGMVPILGDTIDAADVAYGVRNRDPARAGFGLLGLALGPLGGGAALRELFKRSKRSRKALEAPRQPLLLGSGPTSFELEREPGEMLLGLPGLWRSNALETIERAPRHSMTPSQWEAYLKKKPGGIKKIASHLQRLDAQNPNQKISRDELLGVTESQLAPERSLNRQVRSLDRAADVVYDTDVARGPLGAGFVEDIVKQFEMASSRPIDHEARLGGYESDIRIFGLRREDLVGLSPKVVIDYISRKMLTDSDGLATYPERLLREGVEVSDQAMKEFDNIIEDIEFSKTKGLMGIIDRLKQFERGVLSPHEQAVPAIRTVKDPLLDLLASTMQEPLILKDGTQLTIPEIAAKGITSDQLLRRLSRGHAGNAVAIENLFESGSPIQSLEDFTAKVNQKLVAVTRGSDTESLSPLKTVGRLMPEYGPDPVHRFPESRHGSRHSDTPAPYEEIVYYLDPEEIGSKDVSGSAGHFDSVDNQVMHARVSKRPFFIAHAQEGARKVYFVEELQSDAHQRAAQAKRKTKKRFGAETSGYSKARSQLDDRDFKGISGEEGIHSKLVDSSEDLRNAEREFFDAKVKAAQTGLLRSEGYTKEFIDEFIKRMDGYVEMAAFEDFSYEGQYRADALLNGGVDELGGFVPEEVKSLFKELSALKSAHLDSRDDIRADALNALGSYTKKVKKRMSESLVMTTEAKQDIIDAIDHFDTEMLESGRLANEMLIEAVNPSEDIPFKNGSEWARFMIQDLLRKAAAEGAEGFTIITPDQLRLSMNIRPHFDDPRRGIHTRWKGNLNWYGEVLPNILKKEAKRLGLEIQSGLPVDRGTGISFDLDINATSEGLAELDLMTPKQRKLSQIENVVIMLDDEARKKILSDIPSFKFGGLVN